MQNLSFKFHNFSFQSYKFEFCHFNSLRLCLVTVKYFPENKYFPEILFSEKENIFKCLVAL